jgi:hypothetical protein
MLHPLLSASGSGKPKLLDQVRDTIRLRHYSLGMEQAYSDWIRRFTLFHNKIISGRAWSFRRAAKSDRQGRRGDWLPNPKNPRHPR